MAFHSLPALGSAARYDYNTTYALFFSSPPPPLAVSVQAIGLKVDEEVLFSVWEIGYSNIFFPTEVNILARFPWLVTFALLQQDRKICLIFAWSKACKIYFSGARGKLFNRFTGK